MKNADLNLQNIDVRIGDLMAFNPSTLSSVLERFPDRKETIKRLFKKSETFQTLCKDRRRCVEAFQHWCRSDAEEAEARRDEYIALLLDLEKEILLFLNNSSRQLYS